MSKHILMSACCSREAAERSAARTMSDSRAAERDDHTDNPVPRVLPDRETRDLDRVAHLAPDLPLPKARWKRPGIRHADRASERRSSMLNLANNPAAPGAHAQ